MKTAFKTLIENFEYVENAMKYNYTNGFTEGTNNFIKVLKDLLLDINQSSNLEIGDTNNFEP